MTKADLRNLVLRHLSKLPEGVTVPSDHDAAVVEASIDRCQAMLEADEIAYWDADDIPELVASPLKHYVAGEVVLEFLPPDEATQYIVAKDRAERRLLELTAAKGGDVAYTFY